MRNLIDISGNKYGRLTVLKFDHIGNRRRSYWLCECDCGNKVILRKDAFAYKYSNQKSCGCWHIEESRYRMTKNNLEKPSLFFMNMAQKNIDNNKKKN